ncbi:MAG: MFS transporter [Planctomycetes bacterium]|nr:MFS transporter [Planctomycetota bacterium]
MTRNLALLWTGQFVSQLGDALLSAVLVFLVLSLSPAGSAGTRAGLVQLAATLPFLLFSPLSGILADRVDRRKLMLATDVARAAVLGAVPVLWHFGLVTWAVLGAAAFLVSTFSTAFAPARDALVPDLAEGASLVRINSLLQTSTQVAMVAGMLVAAAVLGAGQNRGGPDAMIALIGANAGTFLFSFACLALIRLPRRPAHAEGPRAHAAAGLALALRSPLLRMLLLLTAVDNFFIMGPALVGSGLLVKHTFGLGARHLALFEACLAGGWFAGTLALGSVAHRLPKGPTLLAGMFLDGVTYLPLFWIRSFPLACLAVFAHGLSIPLITVPRTSLVQERVEAGMRAQVFSLVQLTVVGFTALSAAVTGFLGDRIPAPALFLWAGVGAMVGIAGVFSAALRGAK